MLSNSSSRKDSNFSVVGKLGEGGYAMVISVKDKNGVVSALKQVFHKRAKVEESCGTINMKELYIMAHIKHPYIQSAKQVFFTNPCPSSPFRLSHDQAFDRIFFLMDVANYSCHEMSHNHRAYISQIKRAMFQTTCALQYLHGEGICHRDVKPGNILCYCNEGILTCKLTDFGMSKPLSIINRHSLHAGTSYYRAPELIMQNHDYNFKMDVWALGCTFFEMVTKKPLFKGDGDIGMLTLMFKARGSPSVQTLKKMAAPSFISRVGNYKPKNMISLLALKPNDARSFTTQNDVENYTHNPGTLPQFADLLDKMLQIDPSDRPTMDQVVLAPFFSGHFEDRPNQHGLWKPDIKHLNPEFRHEKIGKMIQHFPSKHKYWNLGPLALIELAHASPLYNAEIMYSIRFHGLDIYNRVLLRIEPLEDHEEYTKLLWVSAYIASKFFLDEASAHLWDMFPESAHQIDSIEITNYERQILQILDFEIYRHTVFTFLEERSFYAALFNLCMYPDYVYDRPIYKIMEIFNREVKAIKKMYPDSLMPLD